MNQTGNKMELKTGTKILYTSAAGTREATILEIKIGPTGDPKRLNTWMTLDIPVQKGVKFNTTARITADSGSLKAFRVEVI